MSNFTDSAMAAFATDAQAAAAADGLHLQTEQSKMPQDGAQCRQANTNFWTAQVLHSIFVIDLKIVKWGAVEHDELRNLPLAPKGEAS